MPWALICFILALVLFLLATIGVERSPLHLGWAGAFFLTLALTISLGTA